MGGAAAAAGILTSSSSPRNANQDEGELNLRSKAAAAAAAAALAQKEEEEPEEGIGTAFPSLSIDLLRCHRPRSILANPPRPIPIETDTFTGHFLLLLRDNRSTPLEPRYHRHMFEGKQRRFCIQVQGRFKVRREGGRERRRAGKETR